MAVAVVSFNTRELLDTCLTTLHASQQAGLAEVWVVDNRSTDGSAEMVADRHPWVQLVRPAANLGFGPAVNLVAARTRTPWIAAANSDIRVGEEALQTLVATGEADLSAGAVAPRLILPDGSTQPSIQIFPSLGATLVRLSRVARFVPAVGRWLHLSSAWDPDRRAQGPWATGAFLLLRRAAFERVGGFDEAVWMYGEDLELGWRLQEEGWTTVYEPAAVVHHDHSVASTAAFGDGLLDRSVGASYDWLARRRGLRHARAIARAQLADAWVRSVIARPLAPRSEVWRRRGEEAALDIRKHRLGLRPAEEMLRGQGRPDQSR